MARWGISAAAGLIAFLVVWMRQAVPDVHPTDFAQTWVASRLLLDGRNPYAEIGPGLFFPWINGYFYPLTAAVAALPLAALPRVIAEASFAGLGASLFTYAVIRRGRWALLLVASPSLLFALQTSQWSPLLAAGFLIPPLAMLYAAKPTIAAALFLARPTWWPIAGGLLLTAGAFALLPSWPAEWLRALSETSVVEESQARVPYAAPVLVPGGFLALLALARWRRPEARLVALLSLVPQTLKLYETVPLLLVATRPLEAWWFVVAGYVALGVIHYFAPYDSTQAEFLVSGPLIVWLFYVPAAIMVLRRPNTRGMPADEDAHDSGSPSDSGFAATSRWTSIPR